LNPFARRILALCGVTQPIVFAAFVVAESLLEPNYSQIADHVSDYAVGPYGLLQDINFWITGVLLLCFSGGLRAGLQDGGWTARVGPGLVAIAGVMAILVGVFVTDLEGAPTTVHGTFHTAFSFIAFASLTGAAWVVRAAQLDDPRWNSFVTISTCLAIAASVGLLLLFSVSLPGVAGLVERIPLAALFLWVGITGGKLFSVSSTPI
jgi:hypothetical membrane protein